MLQLVLMESWLSPNVRSFLLAQFFTLYYHQELVDRYRIYYDRNQFRRIFQYLEQHYLLCQYRRVYSLPKVGERFLGYPLVIRNHFWYLKFLSVFFAFFAVRCGFIVLMPSLTKSFEIRIWLGTEQFKAARLYIETAFLFWSSISVLFLRFSLTDQMLDYKFMAVYRMSLVDRNYHKPKDFGKSNCAQFKY